MSSSRRRNSIRWNVVAKARAFAEAGFYDDPEIVAFCAERSADAIQNDVANCAIGDGAKYRDLVAETLGSCLGDIVDVPLMSKEFPSEGGFGDIAIPLRLERLSKYPLWESWQRKFDIKSIVAEAKNTRMEAGVPAVQQILSYLVTGRRGRFGLLVSRSGFTDNAIEQMQAVADINQYLILPCNGDDLLYLASKRREASEQVMEFFRRKETLLIQAA